MSDQVVCSSAMQCDLHFNNVQTLQLFEALDLRYSATGEDVIAMAEAFQRDLSRLYDELRALRQERGFSAACREAELYATLKGVYEE